MNNKDRKMLESCISNIKEGSNLLDNVQCEHPLDQDVADSLQKLFSSIRDNDDDYQIFRHRDKTDELWRLLIEKAIKCLRFYDEREPFKENPEKTPKAYGVDELKKYYDKYTEFERLLYGSNQHYRDHVVHVFRTWLSGVELLTKNNGVYLNEITIHEKDCTIALENVEKLSIWTLIALTHDLGYPLEKAKSIIDATRAMVATFITNPDISVDFYFHGVQNHMNDFIVRLMSSKMKLHPESDRTSEQTGRKEENYVARLQPKYYFKFQKSLERNHHGILSTLIIYKLLTYFLESDYNVNEDYTFDKEERRQFYIRREILRAIASHTCDDVYQLYMTSFAFLLRICDDTQEWGRKSISELYVESNQKYEINDIGLRTAEEQGKDHECTIKELITLDNPHTVTKLIERFREQSIKYVMVFRDGQDTKNRDFSFIRKILIQCGEIEINLTLNISKDRASTLKGEVQYCSDELKNRPFDQTFFSKIASEIKIFDKMNNSKENGSTPRDWHKGIFDISLS